MCDYVWLICVSENYVTHGAVHWLLKLIKLNHQLLTLMLICHVLKDIHNQVCEQLLSCRGGVMSCHLNGLSIMSYVQAKHHPTPVSLPVLALHPLLPPQAHHPLFHRLRAVPLLLRLPLSCHQPCLPVQPNPMFMPRQVLV